MSTSRNTEIRELLAKLKSTAKGAAEAKKLIQKITLTSINQSSTDVLNKFVNLIKEHAATFDSDKLKAGRRGSLSEDDENNRIRKFYKEYNLDSIFDLGKINDQARQTEALLFAVLSDFAESYLQPDSAILEFIGTNLGAETASACANKDFQYGSDALKLICMKAIKEIYEENNGIQLLEENASGKYEVNEAFIEMLDKKLAAQKSKELSELFERNGFITPETPQMLAATNLALKKFRDEQAWIFYSNPIATSNESSYTLFRDLDRGMIVNNNAFHKSPEYDAYNNFKKQKTALSAEEIDQQLVKQVRAFFKRVLFNDDENAFNKYYPKILKSYSQEILHPFKEAMHFGNGVDFVSLDVDHNAHIKFSEGEITLDTNIYNVNVTDTMDGSKVPVPIVITYTSKLTDEGFKFSHGLLKSSYIQQICLQQELLDTDKEKIAKAVKENNDYFVPILAQLPNSPFTDQIINVINQAKNLYIQGQLSPLSYLATVNTLCSIADFSHTPKLTSISYFTAIFDMTDVKTHSDFIKNLRTIAGDIHAIVSDYLVSNPEEDGFEDDVEKLKECTNEPEILTIVEEEKNLFQRAWTSVKNFAYEHRALLIGIAVTTAAIALVIGISIATLGIGAIAAGVGVGLAYLGIGGAFTAFVTSTAVIATAVGAAAFAAATYVSFGIITAAYTFGAWLKNKLTAQPVASLEPKYKIVANKGNTNAFISRTGRPSDNSNSLSSSRSRSTSPERTDGSDESSDEKQKLVKKSKASGSSSSPSASDSENDGKLAPSSNIKSAIRI